MQSFLRKAFIYFQADVHYVFNNYGTAFCCYLLLGAYSTNYFNDIPSNGPYDDDQVSPGIGLW